MASREVFKALRPAGGRGAIYKKWEESGYFNPDNLPGEQTRGAFFDRTAAA